MANTKKPRPNDPQPAARDLLDHVERVLLKWLRPNYRVVLALSGGLDSVVALDLLDEFGRRHPPSPFSFSALHIDHRLSPNSRGWAGFCADLCAARAIPLISVAVEIDRRGAGIEAASRAARYRVFAETNADVIVTAHHLDDQVETLLLQLLRGAGARGASAMPVMMAQSKADGGRQIEATWILRPLLEVTRSQILAYARARDLRWIDDESNDSASFDRNYLRHRVLPVIEQRFPAYRATLARASRHFADASALLDQLAESDAADAIAPRSLRIDALRKLDRNRARNLMRYFLARCAVVLPNARRLDEIIRQCLGTSDDTRLCIGLGNWQLRRFSGTLRVGAARNSPAPFDVCWRNEARLQLPGGTLLTVPTTGAGINLDRLSKQPVTVKNRHGGERLRPDAQRPRRTVKNLLRESRIPSWERRQLPFLFSGDTLVWVPGIGIEAAYQTLPGEPGIVVEWLPAEDNGS